MWDTPQASWTRVILLFLAVATITHLPAFSRTFWNPDEGFLATQARALNTEDGQFYQIIVDRKPPLLPYLYAWVFKLFGDHGLSTVVVIRALAIVVHVITAVLITQIAKRRFGRHGVWAGLLYLLGSAGMAPEDSQAASFEVFMLPWTCAAFLLADSARRRRARAVPLLAGAGVAAALATLTKQTAGVTMLPVMWRAWKDKRWKGLATVIPAFALPILGVALWVGFGDFFFWVFTGNSEYLTSLGSFSTIMARLWGNLGIFSGASAAAFLAIMYMTARNGIFKADADLWLWLAGAAIGVSSGFHFFGHYFLQMLPPIVILATGALHRNGSRLRWTMLGVTAITATLFLTLAFTWPRTNKEHNWEVAQAVQKAADGRALPIIVWGMDPSIYFMSGQIPASRFITAGFLSGFAGGGEQDKVPEIVYDPNSPMVGMAQDFLNLLRKGQAPKLFVDDSWGKPYQPKDIAVIDDLLTNYYTFVRGVDHTFVYELKDRDGLRVWAQTIVDKGMQDVWNKNQWDFINPGDD
ncbi:ArnT family glycosyltransferase [Catenulispora subtropica]